MADSFEIDMTDGFRMVLNNGCDVTDSCDDVIDRCDFVIDRCDVVIQKVSWCD